MKWNVKQMFVMRVNGSKSDRRDEIYSSAETLP